MRKNLLVLFMALVISVGAGELAVRFLGNIDPGLLTYNSWFHQVDKVVVLKGFIADSNGIMRIDPVAALYMDSIISHYDYETVPRSHENYVGDLEGNEICGEIYGQEDSYFDLKKPGFKNGFKQYLDRLKLRPAAQLDDADSAVLQYALTPFNSDGFRGIPFKRYSSKKKKILLIGDSFVFGHSASNLTNAFSDLLLTKGYVVYNAGITFTDPAQYLGIAKKYIPLLQPDIVIVNFYMGNDIAYFHRKLLPGILNFYPTNAAFFSNCPDGIYFNSAEEAYDFVARTLTIPPNNLFNKFCSSSAIGTLIWKTLDKKGLVDNKVKENTEYNKKAELLKTEKPYSNIEIDSIRLVAEAYSSKFILAIIPDLQKNVLVTPAIVNGVLDSIPYFVPGALTAKDYDGDGGHYNDMGHKKHAEFLDSLIRKAAN